MNRRFTYIGISLIVLLMACVEETLQFNPDDLEGNWKITVAERNGKVTRLMKGGYFNFTSGNIIETNVNGDTIKVGYAVKKDILDLEYPRLKFKVLQLSNDTLRMYSRIGNNKFNFTASQLEDNN